LKRNVNESPGSTSRNATLGAMRAAWKSIECGIEPPFFSVISTVWPSRTWMTGPGAPWPSNAQVLYFTPGAIWTVMSLRVMLTWTRSPPGTAGSAAGRAACASASASAFGAALPAKLVSGRLVFAVAAAEWSWPVGRPDAATCALAAAASSRALSAECATTTRMSTSAPTASPSSSTATPASTP
jgi:hypothetical protein